MKRHFCLLLLLLLSLVVACGDDDATDAGADAATDGAADAAVDGDMDGSMVCEGVEPFAEGGEGAADPLDVPAGEARAGRIAAADLPEDPNDLAVWEGNDWVIANENIAFVIEDVGISDQYDPWGGKIVGVAQVREGALFQPADYNEVIIGAGRFTNEVTHVGVINDGTDGEAAVIRAYGPMRALPFGDAFAMGLLPGSYDGVELAMDYILEPGAEKLDVRYSFRNEGGATGTQATLLAFQRERMPAFAPEFGFNITGMVDYLGFTREGITGYAVDSPLRDWGLILEISGTYLMTGANIRMEACSVTEVEMATIYAGGPSMSGLLEAIARENEESLRTVTGRVLEADGSGAEGVRVHASSGETYYARDLTDADGNWSLVLPPDVDVTLSTWRRGDLITETALASDEAEKEITLGPTGTIEVISTEGGVPVPVRVQVEPATGPAERPANTWGEATAPGGRMHLVFPGTEAASVRVPVGDHRVIVSRGFEYELGANDVVSVTEDNTTTVNAELQRVVETPNIMCADYHIHTFRSPDSPDPARFKLRSAAGDGLEIPLRSEHEWVHEWESLIAEEGLTDYLFGVTSLELTTFEWGHFGVFPLDPDTAAPNRGAPNWYYRNPPDVFDEVRAGPTAPSVIVNHPRSLAGQGYFTAAGYDPTTGTVSNPELWDDSIGLYEFFNDSAFEENPELVADWFSFLNAGRRVFAVGSSDSHKVLRGSPVGYPRTCLDMGTDLPNDLRSMDGPTFLQTQTTAGEFFVSGGIYLDVTAADGTRPGGDVAGAGETEMLSVRVQAASWIDADTLELYVDGELISSTPIEAGDGVDRGTYMLSVPVDAAGSWAIVHAKGDMPLDPMVFGRLPFAVSMPIFFER